MSDISEQEPSNTIGELKKLMSSEVGKAEGGRKLALRQLRRKRRVSKNLPFVKLT